MNTRTIPNSLRLYRKKRGLKQRDVARILGVRSAAMISRWEKGQTLPSTLNVFRLALIYRTMTDTLYMDYISVLKAEIRTREEELIG
jgi:transcriptional regulator with XRE-family HTH domain